VAVWSFVYTIEREPFTVPANGAATVACPALAVAPATLPTVTSNCGETLTPTGPVVTNSPNPLTCEGTRTYAYTYTDCEGNTAVWSFVYTIEREPFTVPANGAATVACPALAVAPATLPTVTSACGENLTPTGPVVTNVPNPLTCEGTRTYAYTYTDCEGNVAVWSFVYTIEREPFTVPANGAATVACPAMANVMPVPPTVTSNCGEVLTPVVTSSPLVNCEANRAWYFTYTDCEGNSATWTFMYNVEYESFSVPPNVAYDMDCPIGDPTPTPPVVFDNCGNLLAPFGPEVTSVNNAQGCESIRLYRWRYRDCEGNTKFWTAIINYHYEADFLVPQDEAYTVSCLSYAVPPVPPVVYDNCGKAVSVSEPVLTELPGGTSCTGTRSYTYIYTGCSGQSHPWTFTYHADDNEPPVGNCPNMRVSGLSCVEDIPCPEDDFSGVAAELLAAGEFKDACSGTDLIVKLDSWTALLTCNDIDGDSIFTFERTYYFAIADPCGNKFPELCSVTYSGVCQPITMLPTVAWSQNGGEEVPPVDPSFVQALIDTYGPLAIGGSNGSLIVDDAGCLGQLMPGDGYPSPLEKCNQTNCGLGCNPSGGGGLVNTLATHALAFKLGFWMSAKFSELDPEVLGEQPLGCFDIDGNIVTCNESGCLLHLFAGNGEEHVFPYTLNGLMELVDVYLSGDLFIEIGESGVYATAIEKTLKDMLAYYGDGGDFQTGGCNADDAKSPDFEVEKALPKDNPGMGKAGLTVAPNPAGREVSVRLTGLHGEQETILTIFNNYGQVVLRKAFGRVVSIDEQIDLTGLGNGLYFIIVKAGGERFEQKLVVEMD
jgi:hypothetical protein